MKGGNTMNKKDLVDRVAESTGYHKKEIKDILEGTLNSIVKALSEDEKVQLVGFGTFEVATRAAREGRNPQTGKKIKIASRKVPKFRPGKALKDEIQ